MTTMKWLAQLCVASVLSFAASQSETEAGLPASNDPAKTVVFGVVVDESGKPIAGVDVRVSDRDAANCLTDADGRFRLVLDQPDLGITPIVAATSDRSKQAIFIARGPDGDKALVEARLTLRPARDLAVEVIDGAGKPVPAATVAAVSSITAGAIARAKTDDVGTVILRLPADAEILWVVAAKHGAGLDYFENYQVWPPPFETPSLPAAIRLRLNGARKVIQVKLVDTANRPIAGVDLTPTDIAKTRKLSYVNLSGCPLGSALSKRTDAQGVATFDFLPTDLRSDVLFRARSKEYHQPGRIEYDVTQPDAVAEGKLYRNAHVSGTVTGPDGRPAAGIRIQAEGRGGYYCRTAARTGADGTYQLTLAPDQTYIVAVTDDEWAATAVTGLQITENEKRLGLDFRLSRGTLLTGRVAVGTPPQPAGNHTVTLIQHEATTSGGQPTQALVRWATTDAAGHYRIRIGPGQYEVSPASAKKRDAITVAAESSIAKDFHLDRLPRGPLSGVVRMTDGALAGKARVFGEAIDVRGHVGISTTADGNGQFKAERWRDKMLLYSYSANGKAAASRMIGADDASTLMTLMPGATASGKVVGPDGKPWPGISLQASVYIVGDGTPVGFHRRVTTDADGRYVVLGLPPGARCFVYPPIGMLDGCVLLSRDGKTDDRAAHTFDVTGTEAIRLGDIKLPEQK